MVDDVLMLINYVVKAPSVSRIKRGQSWVPTIADLRGVSKHISQRLSRPAAALGE
jgi:hypothetical protein